MNEVVTIKQQIKTINTDTTKINETIKNMVERLEKVNNPHAKEHAVNVVYTVQRGTMDWVTDTND